MSTIPHTEKLEKEQARVQSYPASSTRFHWTASALSALITAGVYLDGWAHNHGKVDQTFFTPWHAILYSSVFIFSAFLMVIQLRNMIRGHAWRRALPAGYLGSLAGSFLFLIGGGLDLIWHTLFGVEVNLETLLSPTHLLLATSGVLMISGPLRAAWSEKQAEEFSGWKTLGPVILAMTLVLSILTFFTQFAHPMNNLIQFGRGQALIVASILFQSALLMGFILLAVRSWILPFGSLTLLIFVNAALTSTQHDHYILLPAALLSGLLADLLLVWLRPSAARGWPFQLFAFSVPVTFYSLYFLTQKLTTGLDWPPSLWLGAIFMAGIVGLLLSFLVAGKDCPE